jgi:hypothetical protein
MYTTNLLVVITLACGDKSTGDLQLFCHEKSHDSAIATASSCRIAGMLSS